MTKCIVNPSEIKASIPEEKTYTVLGSKTYLACYALACTVPYIIIMIVTGALENVDFAWWAFGVFFGLLGCVVSHMCRKSIKIVLHTDKSVSHMNIFGKYINGQNHIPLFKYETIILDGHQIKYVKSDEYLEELRTKHKLFACCIPKTECYCVREVEEFAKDHDMTSTFSDDHDVTTSADDNVV